MTLTREAKALASGCTEVRLGKCLSLKNEADILSFLLVPEKSGSIYASISVGDRVRVRWRPPHLDDEVAAGHRKA